MEVDEIGSRWIGNKPYSLICIGLVPLLLLLILSTPILSTPISSTPFSYSLGVFLLKNVNLIQNVNQFLGNLYELALSVVKHRK